MPTKSRGSSGPGPKKTVKPVTTDHESDAADSEYTRAAFVKRTGSGYTVVRQVFVQRYDGDERASTVARFLSTRKRRALILYLLLLTGWDPERKPNRSEVWLRALQVDKGKTTWSASSVSQGWSDLVTMGLVERKRERRLAKITPRREDALEDYTKPDGKKKINRYFTLPGEFWTECWFDELSLPAICVLLVILKETNRDDEIHLTYEQMDQWYGVSVSSAKKGCGELESAGLLAVRRETVKDAWAPAGFTAHLHYSLNGAFSTASRAKARAEAQEGARARKAAAAKKAPAGIKVKKIKNATRRAKKKAI